MGSTPQGFSLPSGEMSSKDEYNLMIGRGRMMTELVQRFPMRRDRVVAIK